MNKEIADKDTVCKQPFSESGLYAEKSVFGLTFYRL